MNAVPTSKGISGGSTDDNILVPTKPAASLLSRENFLPEVFFCSLSNLRSYSSPFKKNRALTGNLF